MEKARLFCLWILQNKGYVYMQLNKVPGILID